MIHSNLLGAIAIRTAMFGVPSVAGAIAAGCSTHDVVIELRHEGSGSPVADAEVTVRYLRMLSLKPEVPPLHFRTDAAGRLAMRFEFREPTVYIRINPHECTFAGFTVTDYDLKDGDLVSWRSGRGLGAHDPSSCQIEWRAWIGAPDSSPPPVKHRDPRHDWLPPTVLPDAASSPSTTPSER